MYYLGELAIEKSKKGSTLHTPPEADQHQLMD